MPISGPWTYVSEVGIHPGKGKGMIKRYAVSHMEETLELLRKLAVIPAPSGQEQARAEWIRSWLLEKGAENVFIDQAGNVVWPWGSREGTPYVLVSAHTDIVFEDRDPLPLTEDEDRIHVPGIGDDTASVVNLMMAAACFLEQGLQPEQPLLIVFNSGEEGLGNLKGMRQIFRDHRIWEHVAFDHHDMRTLLTIPVGSRRYRISMDCRGGHSYRDFGRKNAIAEMADLITELYRVQVPGRHTTYNVGTIQGGSTVNSIAEHCEILYEFRSQDKAELEAMQRELDRILQKHNGEGVQVCAVCLGDRPCRGEVPEQAMRELTERVRKILQEQSSQEVICTAGSTDCNIPLSLGIPAVCCGVYEGGGCHTREEWIRKSSLMTGQQIALEVLRESGRFC